MWIRLGEEDPLATRVEQELHTCHARTGSDKRVMDLPDILALHECILLCVESVATVKVSPTLRERPRTCMREIVGCKVEVTIAVLLAAGHTVVPCRQNVSTLVEQDAANRPPKTSASASSQLRHAHGPELFGDPVGIHQPWTQKRTDEPLAESLISSNKPSSGRPPE